MVRASIPEPLPADGEDVRWALTTASRLSASGEDEAAVRWLRRAVSAALEIQQVERAAELERFAQLMENQMVSSEDTYVPSTERDEDGPMTAPESLPVPPARALAPTVEEGAATVAFHEMKAALPKRDSDLPFSIDDEHTVVPFTQKAAGVAAPMAETTMRLEAVPPPPADAPEARPWQPEGGSPPASDPDPTVVARSPVRDTLEELRIPAELQDDAPAVSSDTMPTFSRYRVAMLSTSDDEHPRVMWLRPDEDPPPGAGVAYVVPASGEDGRLIAQLLGLFDVD